MDSELQSARRQRSYITAKAFCTSLPHKFTAALSSPCSYKSPTLNRTLFLFKGYLTSRHCVELARCTYLSDYIFLIRVTRRTHSASLARMGQPHPWRPVCLRKTRLHKVSIVPAWRSKAAATFSRPLGTLIMTFMGSTLSKTTPAFLLE